MEAEIVVRLFHPRLLSKPIDQRMQLLLREVDLLCRTIYVE